MIYSYDKAAQIPLMDLYDTRMILANVNAAKDMYEKGVKQLEDFHNKYDDFVAASPADLAWYDKNFTNAMQDLVKYANDNGIDLVRSPEGRSLISNFINTRPISTLAMIKETAKNADTFYKNLAALQQNDLYNPELTKYEGGLPSEYDTVGSGKAWSKLSPTPYKDAGVFSKSYFDGMKPNISTQVKNGISYTSSDITMNDLRKIADDAFNDLVKTGQGQLMYKMFLDKAGGNEEAARLMFNNTIVAGNLKRLHHSDDYVDNLNAALQRQLNRDMQAMRNEIAKMRIENQNKSNSNGGGSGANRNNKFLFSSRKAMQKYGTTAILKQDASIASQLGIVTADDLNTTSAEGWIELAQRHISENTYKDPELRKKLAKLDYDLRNPELPIKSNLINRASSIAGGFLDDARTRNDASEYYERIKNESNAVLHPYNLAYLGNISTEFSAENLRDFMDRGNLNVSGSKLWFELSPEDINGIYVSDDVASHTEGSLASTLKHYSDITRADTKEIQDWIRDHNVNAARGAGFIITPMMTDGVLRILAKVDLGQFESKNNEGDVETPKSVTIPQKLKDKVLYLDIGVRTLGLNSLDLDDSFLSMSRGIALDKSVNASKNSQNTDVEYINTGDMWSDESKYEDYYADPEYFGGEYRGFDNTFNYQINGTNF